jgi:hypothetical protein
MEPLLEQLLNCDPHQRGVRPAAPEQPGVKTPTATPWASTTATSQADADDDAS